MEQEKKIQAEKDYIKTKEIRKQIISLQKELRELNLKIFQNKWLHILQSMGYKLIHDEKNHSYTFELEKYGEVTLFVKSNTLLIKKLNISINPAMKHLIEELGLPKD
jgi:hypothetical protein